MPSPQGNGFSPQEAYTRLLEQLPAAVERALTVDEDGARRALVVSNVQVDTSKFKGFDLDDLQDAKQRDVTLSAPIFADVRLVDKTTGENISEARVRVGDVPYMTPQHNGFMLGGKEYDVFNQLRLRSGLYTHVKQNGDLITMGNLARGRNFQLGYDADSGTVRFHMGHASAPLLPILIATGVTPAQLRAAWGDEFFKQNLKAVKNQGAELIRVGRMISGEEPESPRAAVGVIKAYFEKTQMNPEVNAATLGMPAEKVDAHFLLAASKKLMGVYRGEQQADDRDHLMFKDIYGPDDLILMRLNHWRTNREIKNKIKSKMDRFDTAQQVVKAADLSGVMNKFFLAPAEGSAGLIGLNDQTNPLQFTVPAGKMTMMGQGGISSEHSIPLSTRALHPSHFGIVDGVNVIESGKLGVVLNAAQSAVKMGNRLGTRTIDARTGAEAVVPLTDFMGKTVAMPDQYTVAPDGTRVPIGDKLQAVRGGKSVYATPEEVDYIMPSAASLFSPLTSLVPMLGGVSGARAMIGGKMLEQAIPLKYAEAPMVRAMGDEGAFVEDPARGAARTADVDGQVEKIEPNRIWVRTPDGQLIKHGLYDHYPTQSGTLLHHTPVVQVGEPVTKGQVLADSNFTKGGTLSLGTHLLTAYLPDRGYSHEDGISISESAAKKLTSSHLVVKEFNLNDEMVANKAKFRASFPGHVTDTHAARLDDDGVIRPGETVMPGEHLILGVQRRRPDEADAVLRKMGRKLVKPFSDASVAWDEENAGQVVRVIKEGDKIKVHIRTEKPMKVGDKLSGAGHGNKGIVVRIIPDAEMPHTEDGRPMQVLFNPAGIPGRVNPPAMMEAAAGKISEKDGKPYYVPGFTDASYVDDLEAGLKQRGLSEKEALIDPETGKKIPPVYMGPNYWIKLKHEVDTKYSARDTAGYDVDGQPLRGGLEGAKRLDTLQSYALMAHGANAVLQDISLNKSDKNDAMWSALKRGLPLPPARPAFATDKFLSMLRVAGINPVKRGTEIQLTPFMDADTLKQSKGEIQSARFLRADDATEEKGGMFDPALTGGLHGQNWNHIALAEPVPSPVMEPAIMALTGLSSSEMDGMVSGAMGMDKNGKVGTWHPGMATGGGAIRDLLAKIDPAQELEAVKQQLAVARSRTAIDKLNKKGKYLRALVESGKKPADAYIINHVPVIPPRMRPAYVLPNGAMDVGSLNYLYRDAFLVNEKLKMFSGLDPDLLSPLRADLYDAVRAIQGLGDPITGRDYQGVISTIKGSIPKQGMFQRRLMSRPMDAVGRSTIVPDPNLTPDEIGLPHDMAWTMYQPRIVRELVMSGMPAAAAAKSVEARDERASRALDQVMGRVPVLVNRAPSLHKFSVMALRPHRVDGDALQMPPLPFKGWNADTDGDSMIGDIIVRGMDGIPQAINIADFPKGALVTSAQRKGLGVKQRTDLYPPAQRMQALSIREGMETGWYDVTQFSRHRKLKMYAVKLSGHAEPILLSRDASLVTIDPDDLRPMATEPKKAIGRVVPVAWRIDCGAIEQRSEPDDVAIGAGFGALLVTSLILGDGRIAVATQQKETIRMISSALKLLDPKASLAKGSDFVPVRQVGFRPLTGCRQTGGEFYASMTMNGMERTRTSYFRSTAVERLLREQASAKTAFKDLAQKSAAFKVGVTLGILTGSLAGGPYNKDGYVQGEVAAPLRFAGMVAGLEVRMERLAETGRAIRCTLGFIDPVALYMLQDAVKYFGLHRIMAGVQAEHLQHIGKAGDDIPLGECVNGLYLHKAPTNKHSCAESDKRLPWSEKLFTEAAKKMSPTQRHWVVCLLRDHPTYELSGLLKQDSVSLCRVNRVGREITKSAPDFEKTECWKKLAHYAEATISYERVLGVEELPGFRDAYDLSVPGADTFCAASGATLKNTMMVSVPVSEAAIRQSHDMLPSKHLFNPGTGDLMLVPKAESVHGLYMLTKEGNRTKLRFKDDKAVLDALEDDKVKATDVVMVNNVQTTPGRVKFNQQLPVKYRDAKAPASMQRVRSILQDVARNSPNDYNEVVTNMKKLGDESAYFMGMTIGLEDIRPPREVRDPIMKEATRKFHEAGSTPEAAVEIFTEANKQMDAGLREHYKTHPSQLWDMLESGALGKRGQAMQMLVGPVLVNDEFGNTLPFPITKSFSEGLNVSAYMQSLHGQRKGMIDRRISTAEPGEIQKETIVAALKQQISSEDCGAEGIDLDLDDRSITNRQLGADIVFKGGVIARRGDRITEDVIASAKKSGLKELKVRSPLACEDDHGICQADAGFNETGERYPIGFNLGALAATTITEPLTQGVLRNFHQGGTTFSKTVSGLERIRQLVELPQVMAGQGSLAKMDGVVDSVRKTPAGDHEVMIGGQPHFVHSTLNPVVIEGQQVTKGQPVSTGAQAPREILETRGLDEARKHLVSEMDHAYRTGNNINLDRRFFETIVKTITDHGYVNDAGDHPTALRGDTMPLTRAHRINKDLIAKGLKPMEIEPELKGVVQSATTSDDWMARLGSRFLGKALQQGVGFGLKTETGAGGHPIPRFVMGIHMGDQPIKSGDVALDNTEFDGPLASYESKPAPMPQPVKI